MGPKSILGIGAPFIDHLLAVPEEFLSQAGGDKGGMMLVDAATFERILYASRAALETRIGGSCSNTLRGLARLGNSCAMVGVVGDDALGHYYTKYMQDLGIKTLFTSSHKPTSQALSLVTPDGERTMRSFSDASAELSVEHLLPVAFDSYDLIHMEGYNLFLPDVTETVVQRAEHSVLSLDLSSFEVVERFKERILSLLDVGIDLLFGNEEEMAALTGLPPREAASYIAKQYQCVAIATMGVRGCWVSNMAETVHCPAFPQEAVDSTGAGDLFSCGFIHKYLQGASLSDCARLGALLGAEVVRRVGAEIPMAEWEKFLR